MKLRLRLECMHYQSTINKNKLLLIIVTEIRKFEFEMSKR